jgi:hypothetical protein
MAMLTRMQMGKLKVFKHLYEAFASHVRYGSKADIPHRLADVRFTPKSGH